MIDRKSRKPLQRSKADPRQIEKAWRATTPEAADLPPEEIRTTRAERRALLEIQSAQGDKRADAIRLNEQRDAAERERVRNRRKRPHKQLPAGLVPLAVVVEKRPGKVPAIRISQTTNSETQTLLHLPASYTTLEVVTPELAREVATLRAALGNISSDSNDGSPVVAQEVAIAVRLAAAAAMKAWIPIALTLVHLALMHEIVRARRALDPYEANGRPPPPTTPEAIYRALVERCHLELGFVPPPDVNEHTVAWMLRHLAIGTTRGGGRTKRMSAEKMKEILADPTRRARAAASKRV